jgi:hypothetical protein
VPRCTTQEANDCDRREVQCNYGRSFISISVCVRCTCWSAGSIDIIILVISLKAGSARQISLVGVRGREMELIRFVAHLHKAREDIVAGRTSQDANVGDGGQRHHGLGTTTSRDKNDLVARVYQVCASMILELLTVGLWR